MQAASNAEKEAVRGLRRAAQTIALPSVKATVAHKLPGTTRAGATMKGAYIEQKHPAAALDEFGGVRNDTISPKSGKALRTPAGPRAVVKGPRPYKGAHVLEVAVRRVRPLMEKPTKDALLVAYRDAGFKVS